MASSRKISVIIPAYNEENYILVTLDALMKQDYPDFEVIVVNNASTDRTAVLVEEYIARIPNGRPSFRLVHENRKGTQFARECARRVSSGDYIAQLDADCIPKPNWLSYGIGLFRHPDIIAVTGPYRYWQSPRFFRAFTNLAQFFLLRFVNTIVQLFRRGGVIIGGNAIINAEVLDKAGGYDTNFTFYGDDVATACSLSRYGYIRYSHRLVVNSSSRRYCALGFWKVQRKYSKIFFHFIFHGRYSHNDAEEVIHPR